MCPVILNTLLTNETPNGYFVYLGYSTDTEISTSGSTAFGILSPLDNGVNGDTASDGVVLNNPYTTNTAIGVSRFSILPYNTVIDFTGKSTGFYGFMYVVGDINNTGDVEAAIDNCGGVEAFEIEVLEALPVLVPIEFTECIDDLPSTIDLLDLLETLNTIPSGITVGFGGITPLGTRVDNIITVTSSPIAVTYVYNVIVSITDSEHPIRQGCCDTESTTITITVLNNVSAGTGMTISVCN